MTDDVSPTEVGPARYPRRAMALLLLTVLLGPPVGAFVALGPFLLLPPTTVLSFADLLSKIGGLVMVGYLVGTVRAGLAGVWIAYRVWRDGRIGYLECIAAALAATVLGTIYLLVRIGPDGEATVLFVSGLLCAAAVVAAVVCRWTAGALGILPR